MKHRPIALITSLLFLLSACSDKLNPNILIGAYTGYFYHTKPGENNSIKSQGPVSLSFTAKEYNSSGFESRIPAGGSGEYRFENNNEVEFIDKHVWTADFDWNLVLNGRFS